MPRAGHGTEKLTASSHGNITKACEGDEAGGRPLHCFTGDMRKRGTGRLREATGATRRGKLRCVQLLPPPQASRPGRELPVSVGGATLGTGCVCVCVCANYGRMVLQLLKKFLKEM